MKAVGHGSTSSSDLSQVAGGVSPSALAQHRPPEDFVTSTLESGSRLLAGEDDEPESDDWDRRLWKRYAQHEYPNIFDNLYIAKDGGFSEVHELWNPMRYVTAAMTVGFILSNLYYVVHINLSILEHVPPTEDVHDLEVTKTMFLLTSPVSNLVFHEVNGSHADDMIAYFELLGLTIIMSAALHQLIVIWAAKSERLRWFALDRFFWHSIPHLSSYSAMRLLHYVTPTVFMTSLQDLIDEVSQAQFLQAVRHIVVFLMFHAFCLVVGFDAFLVKIREAYSSINQREMRWRDLYAALLFMVQVLGVVRLGTYVQARLFVFIFAGEDGVMQPEEKAKRNVWNALLIRKIWEAYSLPKFLAIMLSFGDYEFQKLVLNEGADDPKRL